MDVGYVASMGSAASLGSATVHHVVGGRFTFIHISADPRRVHFFPRFCTDVQ